MKNKLKKGLKWVLYYPVLLFICFEIALLVLGYRRYHTDFYKVEIIPKNAFVGNDSLGIELNPGQYTIVLNDSVQFTTIHTEKKQRLTIGYSKNIKEHEIGLLGCSFTYGYGVNNDQTFASILQSKRTNWGVSNYGVIGYGTVQSYLQLQDIIKNKTADIVLLHFSSFHFMRNTLSQVYRSNLRNGYQSSAEQVNTLMRSARFPFIKDSSCIVEYAKWDSLHTNWFGREWFASINWVQTAVEQYKDNAIDQVELTGFLIQKMKMISDDAGIVFAVVCLDSTTETKRVESSLINVPWTNIGFDFTDENFTNLPYDSHPNAKGYRLISEKIDTFLKSLEEDE